MVRTMKVSSSNPTPMTKPICTTVARLLTVNASIEAAKINPADVITPPVAPTVLMTAERTPYFASSRIREISSRL